MKTNEETTVEIDDDVVTKIDPMERTVRFVVEQLVAVIGVQMEFHQNITVALLERSVVSEDMPEAEPLDMMRQRPMSPELAQQVEDAMNQYKIQFPDSGEEYVRPF